jgi:hypothetical protein
MLMDSLRPVTPGAGNAMLMALSCRLSYVAVPRKECKFGIAELYLVERNVASIFKVEE